MRKKKRKNFKWKEKFNFKLYFLYNFSLYLFKYMFLKDKYISLMYIYLFRINI